MKKDSIDKAQDPQAHPVPVLFARRDSVYKGLGCDVFDIDRDARSFRGGRAGIYHPPCRAWGQLAHMAHPRPDEKRLAVWSVMMIRRHGGVLEHPRASKLWTHMSLPAPGQTDSYGGFSVCVDQFWWGHKAQKNTLLYIVGCTADQLPPMPLRFDAVEFTIASKIKKKSGRRIKAELPKSEREKTPAAFAQWLIEVARLCSRPALHPCIVHMNSGQLSASQIGLINEMVERAYKGERAEPAQAKLMPEKAGKSVE